MAVSKVELANGEVLMDLTGDSVTPDTLAEGETAHDATGEPIVGRMKSGGGASVQSDWNQTDETAADFIKNKPFGDEVAEIFPLSDIEFVFDPDMGCAAILEISRTPSIGDTLDVTWDGVGYACEIIDFQGFPVFGSMPSWGIDNGEPFFAMIMDGVIQIADINAQEDVVRSIGISLQTIIKIDEKYISGGNAFFLGEDDAGTNRLFVDAQCLIMATVTDVAKLLNRSQQILLYDNGGYYYAIYASATDAIGYGYVAYVSVGGTVYRFYTAEYTPPTT
ncbi:MAG: hypothetical protein J6Q92_05140 [Oscillospiraceae bacterium]|nr:hypothetical protein [Oscillospiraceae bacterium]